MNFVLDHLVSLVVFTPLLGMVAVAGMPHQVEVT